MLFEVLTKPFSMTMDPSQRIFWPFLLSAALVALALGYKGRWRELLSKSSQLDVKIFLINMFLKATAFPLILFSSYKASVLFLKLLRTISEYAPASDWTPWMQSLVATLIAFTINDFLRFIQHMLMHKIPGLNLLHRTHHSALVLTPLTLFRAHPFESLIAGARNTIAIGLTLALYSFLFGRVISVYDFLGVNAFGFIFNATLANLRHSPIPISFGIFEFIFISPRMHQIHHSSHPDHWDKNYGVALSIWDIAFGSFYRPSREEASSLKFGLHETVDEDAIKEATTLKGALIPKFDDVKLSLNNLVRYKKYQDHIQEGS